MSEIASNDPSSAYSHVANEESWIEAAEVFEAKERELVNCIALNYNRIRGIEKELEELKLQQKLTSGSKKSALEYMRKKIEVQNEKVLIARMKFAQSKRVAEMAEALYNAELNEKVKLCQELNLLVQQSSNAKVERLEELTEKMKFINTNSLESSMNNVEDHKRND